MTTRLLPHEPGKRKCLKCSTMFQSTGAANRICKKCARVNATIHVTEAQLARERGAKRWNGFSIDVPNSYESNPY